MRVGLRTFAAQALESLITIHVGQHEVQNYQVVIVKLTYLEFVFAKA
jgi:hypothetical protein